MNIRINYLLYKCSNSNFRTGFIKYLKSLDYDEFEKIFTYYVTAISTLVIRYENNKPKFFSKRWFKRILLNIKYDKLYFIFHESNIDFIFKWNEKLGNENEKKESLLISIEENRKSLDNIRNMQLSLNDPITIQDIISISVLIIDNIYISKEIDNLMKELYLIDKE